MSDLLVRAAQALEDDPRVMASALAAHRWATGMAEAVQERWLGLAPGTLPRLALCRRPDPVSTTFAQDVVALAAYVRGRPARLHQVLAPVVAADRSSAGSTA